MVGILEIAKHTKLRYLWVVRDFRVFLPVLLRVDIHYRSQ
jgi:hypothetical protein